MEDEPRTMARANHAPAEQRLDDCRANRHDEHRFDEQAEPGELHELATKPWAVKSLSANLNINVLKNNYNRLYLSAHLYRDRDLMTLCPMAIAARGRALHLTLRQ